jgi:hypothetical protein
MSKPTQQRSPINIKKSHVGLLHEKLGLKPGKKIPVATLDNAKMKAKSTKKKEEIQFAINSRKWNK